MTDESKANPTSAGALACPAEGDFAGVCARSAEGAAGASEGDFAGSAQSVPAGSVGGAAGTSRPAPVQPEPAQLESEPAPAQQASTRPSPEDAAIWKGTAVGAPARAQQIQPATAQPATAQPEPARPEDVAFMQLAIEQARIAAALDEVPIGAVVVKDGQVIASACNRREIDADPAGHAEFLAMKEVSRRLGAWRLSGCTVYVTLEPCLMCAGLMYQARIDRCVFGAHDPKAGALGSLYQVNADERLNHTFEVTSGVCQTECAELLRSFFKEKRRRNKARKVQQ